MTDDKKVTYTPLCKGNKWCLYSINVEKDKPKVEVKAEPSLKITKTTKKGMIHVKTNFEGDDNQRKLMLASKVS